MRLPLIPDALAKGKWDITSLDDQEIKDLVHGKVVNGHAAEDTDFPMPLIRHYIKELGVPARRFNMNVAVAKVDVHFDNIQFKDTFVRQNGQLMGTSAYQGQSLDDSVVSFLWGLNHATINEWLRANDVRKGGNHLHDIFERDVTEPAVAGLINTQCAKKNYLDLIDIESWSKFLVTWNVTYKAQLKKKHWPQKLIDFYGYVYRLDMQQVISEEIIEDEIGHWWQPNMFTLTYGMHSLYDAPPGKGFQGFRQVVESKGVNIKLGHVVDSVKCIQIPNHDKNEVNVAGQCSSHSFNEKYDIVLVTVPQPALGKIQFDWSNADVPAHVTPSDVPYPPMHLAKRLLQFKDPFWSYPSNNEGKFEISHLDGFAVVSNDMKKGHLSQLRYSNPELEGNVILNYEFGDNADYLAMEESDKEVLEKIQGFHKKVEVSEEAVLNDASPKKGVFSKPWLDLFGVPNSVSQYEGMQKFSAENGHASSVYFAGDFWSFCPQWQEGALYTALRAVYNIVNGDNAAQNNFKFWQKPQEH